MCARERERAIASLSFFRVRRESAEQLRKKLRSPENQARIQSVLDPIISHIINRIFPYILLSAILFLILFILTIGTFYMVMRTSGGLGGGGLVGGVSG